MALTPVEIRHLKPPKTILRGYRRAPIDELLDEIVLSFEDVWRERADMADKVEQLEADLVRYKELEALLRTTLTSAERAAHEMRERAAQEAELIVAEARAEARSIVRDAGAERERLVADTHRVRAVLRAALEVTDETGAGGSGETTAEAA